MNLFLFLILICDGKRGYKAESIPNELGSNATIASVTHVTTQTTPLPIKQIHIQITGKHELTLPEDDLFLNAKINEPNTESENGLIWSWKALSSPDQKDQQENVQMNGIDTKKLHLSKLAAGDYVFEVEVNDDPPSLYGSGNFSLTVKPAPVINNPPKAVITPASHTITLPNMKVVLDGSSSSDPDDKPSQSDIVSFEWAIKDSSMDQLEELTNFVQAQNEKNVKILELQMSHVGNATFTLTVKDSVGHEDTATATVIVNPENDDPPTANAGENVSINLPRSEVMLCGTNSTDDKGIVKYQWLANPDNRYLTNEMSGVNEKCLKLGGIEHEGIYTYTLTVCDIKDQCDSASVQVVVHKATNIAPVAKLRTDSTYEDVDGNLHFFIPKNREDCTLYLNGCDSVDENNDKLQYKFTDIENNSIIRNNADTPCIGIIENIVSDVYTFQLMVTDSGDPPLSGKADLTISVDFAKPPQIEIVPPLEENKIRISSSQKYVQIDAGRSFSYDHSNLTFSWEASPDSSATYSILNDSNKSGKLEIVDMEPGSYIFNLTIKDGQEQSNSEVIYIDVEEDKNIANIFQIQIPAKYDGSSCGKISVLDKMSIKKELLLYLESSGVTSISIVEMYHEHTNQDIVILAQAYSSRTPVPLSNVLPVLFDSFKTSGFKSFCKSSIPLVKSFVCLADCSGHGTCNNGTNTCLCDRFWMPSPFIHQTNCAWSVVYFCLAIIGLFVLLVITGFSLKSMHQRKQRKMRKQKTRKFNRAKKDYARLIQSDSDEQIEMQVPARRKKRKKQKEEIKNHTTPEYTDESSNTLFDMTAPTEQAC